MTWCSLRVSQFQHGVECFQHAKEKQKNECFQHAKEKQKKVFSAREPETKEFILSYATYTCVAKRAWNGGHVCHWGGLLSEDVPLVQFTYLAFNCMPGEIYRRRLGSVLCSSDVFLTLMGSLVC